MIRFQQPRSRHRSDVRRPQPSRRAAERQPFARDRFLRRRDESRAHARADATTALPPRPKPSAACGDLRSSGRVRDITDDQELAQLRHTLLRPGRARAPRIGLDAPCVDRASAVWESLDYLPVVNESLLQVRRTCNSESNPPLPRVGLQFSIPKRLQNLGQVRWDELDTCHVAIFDLRRAGEIASLATKFPKQRRELRRGCVRARSRFRARRAGCRRSAPRAK